MIEIEAKVPLSQKSFQRIKRELEKTAKKIEVRTCKDQYYQAPKAHSLRIREQDKGATLDLKTKSRKERIEMNQETRLPLKDAGAMNRLLLKLGLRPWVQKEKRSLVHRYGNMSIELNEVQDLGRYLEIEILVDSKTQIPAAKKQLDRAFGKYGFTKGDCEPKYYLELLAEKRRKRSN